MDPLGQLVVFSIEGQRFGLDVIVVDRIVPAVEVTRLPGLPEHLLGLISVKGSDVPVLDMRRLLSLPLREVRARDKMIIAGGPKRAVALVIDDVAGFAPCPTENRVANDSQSDSNEIIVGTLKDVEGMILVCNEELLLLSGEAQALDAIEAGR